MMVHYVDPPCQQTSLSALLALKEQAAAKGVDSVEVHLGRTAGRI